MTLGPERKERAHYRQKTIYSREYAVFLRLFQDAKSKAGLTQEQIAATMHQDQAMISRCFTGSRRVDIVELHSFLNTMGVSLGDFVRDLEEGWRSDDSGEEEAVVSSSEPLG